MTISGSESFTIDRYNINNSDIKFRSSDGVEFNLHLALLQANTGAFPDSEIDTQGEVIQLTEPADVLKIIFDFVYPRRHPDLDDRGFKLVAAVAEAVEKYEVFPAMLPCNARLRVFLPHHPGEILVHAIKHNYPKMINEAVPLLARSSFISVLEELPTRYVIPWSRYNEAWVSAFRQARKFVRALPSTAHQSCDHSSHICGICQSSMFKWLTDLEEIQTVSALNNTLQNASFAGSGDCCKKYSKKSKYQEDNCLYMKKVGELCLGRIQAIPPFTELFGKNI